MDALITSPILKQVYNLLQNKMTQASTEKKLLIIYGVSLVMGLIVTITTAIAWYHWKPTLDRCIYTNCSCILFGEHTPEIFRGGPQASCVFITYGPIFYILFAATFVCFHGYRYLFLSKKSSARTVMSRNGEGDTMHMAIQIEDSTPLPKAFWITLSSFSIIFVLYCLIHFIIFLTGYYRTCKEYRKTLGNELQILGSALPLIYDRLSCGSIFDFMDYLHPVSDKTYWYGFINTGLNLMIGVISSFFATILFLSASFLNVKRARVND